MTREEARQIIATWLVSSKGARGQRGYIEGWFDEEDSKAFRMAIEALSADAVHGWIPVTERLPKEERKTYWVCTNTACQCECRWTNNRFGIGEGEWGWSIFDTPQYSKPIAWMPLPEPYKGGEEDE